MSQEFSRGGQAKFRQEIQYLHRTNSFIIDTELTKEGQSLMTTSRMTPQLTENAQTVLKARYLIGDETAADLFTRVARAVASTEAPESQAKWEETFYNLMASTKFMPNSPTPPSRKVSSGAACE